MKNKLTEITDNFEIICIFQLKANKQSKEIYIHENITIIQLYTIDDSDGVIFLNDSDTEFYKDMIYDIYNFDLYPIQD